MSPIRHVRPVWGCVVVRFAVCQEYDHFGYEQKYNSKIKIVVFDNKFALLNVVKQLKYSERNKFVQGPQSI